PCSLHWPPVAQATLSWLVLKSRLLLHRKPLTKPKLLQLLLRKLLLMHKPRLIRHCKPLTQQKPLLTKRTARSIALSRNPCTSNFLSAKKPGNCRVFLFSGFQFCFMVLAAGGDVCDALRLFTKRDGPTGVGRPLASNLAT